MKATQFITDKNHTFAPQAVFPLTAPMARAITLDFGDKANSDILGVGVAITGASCYNLSLMEKAQRTALLSRIYGKDGLGFSVGRLSIGSSDYSAELYTYDDVPFDTELKHFSVERDEAYIIPMIKEILAINPDLFLLASPWTPPAWMKTGNDLCYGYMRAEYVECYAAYIVKYIKAYAAHGIKIGAITPQNEPETQHEGTVAACIWHPDIEAAFIKTLYKKLQAEGLDVKIWMHDHNFSQTERVLWELDEHEGLADCCDGVAYHYYGGTVRETDRVKERYPDLNLYYTESGPRLFDHYDSDWCKWTILFSQTLGGSFRNFIGWNLLLNEMGAPNIGPFSCGGLVTRHSMTGELSYSGQYKAFSHLAPYLNRSTKIYAVTQNERFGQEMSNYPKLKREACGLLLDNGDGKKVLVLANPAENKKQTQLCIDGTWWYVELPADSVSTVIIEE